MAIIHRAQIRPTKLELLQAWLPEQPWYTAEPGASLTVVGAYRFDDPDGEVGVETHLVRAGDPVLQVPLTYRGAPLAGADPWLVTTMEHSVLGRRWVYDGTGDPVYVAALAAAILGGGGQAEEVVETEDGPRPRAATVSVRGSGAPGEPVSAPAKVDDLICATDAGVTECAVPGVEVEIRRVLDASTAVSGEHRLSGTWEGQDEPVVLAAARRR